MSRIYSHQKPTTTLTGILKRIVGIFQPKPPPSPGRMVPVTVHYTFDANMSYCVRVEEAGHKPIKQEVHRYFWKWLVETGPIEMIGVYQPGTKSYELYNKPGGIYASRI